MARPTGTQNTATYYIEPPDDMIGIGMGSMESLSSSNASYSTSESAPSSRKCTNIAHDAETVRTMGPRSLQNNPNFRSTWSRSSNGLVWTSEQDEVLRAGVLRHGSDDWKVISDHVATCGSFSQADCKLRWAEIKELPVKGPWSPDEDGLLCDLVARFGPKPKKWSYIATQIPGRAGKQCRERWLNHLDLSVKKGEWTFEEDRILCQAQREVGNKWSEIAKLLPGRAENSVKNRYNSLITRRQISQGGGSMSMGMGQMEHMRAVSPEACPSPPLALSLPPKAPKNVNKNGGESRRPGRPRKNPLKLPKSRSPSPTKTRTSNRKKKAPPAKSPPQTTPEQRQDMQEEEDEQEEEEQEPYMVEEPLLSDSEMDTLLASLNSAQPSPYMPTEPYPSALDHSTSTLSSLPTHPSSGSLHAPSPTNTLNTGLGMGPFMYLPKAHPPGLLQSLMTPQASLSAPPTGYFPFACPSNAYPSPAFGATPSILRPPMTHRSRHQRKSRGTLPDPPLASPPAQYLPSLPYPPPQLYALPQAEALATAYLQQLQAATQAFKNALPTPVSLGFPSMLLPFHGPLVPPPVGPLPLSTLSSPMQLSDPRTHTDAGEFVSPLPSPRTHDPSPVEPERDEPCQTGPSPRATQPSPAYLMARNALSQSMGSEEWSLMEPVMPPGDDGHSLAGGMDEANRANSQGGQVGSHGGHGSGQGYVMQDRASGQSSMRHGAGTPFSIDFSWLDQQQQGSYSAEMYEAQFGGQPTQGGEAGSKRPMLAMQPPAAWAVEAEEGDIGMVDFDETGEDQEFIGMLGEAEEQDMAHHRPAKRMR